MSARRRALCVLSPGPHCLPRPFPTSTSTMSSISRSLENTSQMTAFILRNFLPDYKDVFDEVQDNSIQTGDIVLFNMESSSNTVISFKHAAVYCGEGEVIHFQNIERPNRGQINKEGFQVMRHQRRECNVLRKKAGTNLATFKMKVKELMNSTAQHSLVNNNCINFAL